MGWRLSEWLERRAERLVMVAVLYTGVAAPLTVSILVTSSTAIWCLEFTSLAFAALALLLMRHTSASCTLACESNAVDTSGRDTSTSSDSRSTFSPALSSPSAVTTSFTKRPQDVLVDDRVRTPLVHPPLAPLVTPTLETPLERVQLQLRALLDRIVDTAGHDESHAAAVAKVLELVDGLSLRGEARAMFETGLGWLDDAGDGMFAGDDETREYLAQMVTDGQTKKWEPQAGVHDSIKKWVKRSRRVSHDEDRLAHMGQRNISFMQRERASRKGKEPSLVEMANFRAMQEVEEPGSGVRLGGGKWSALPTSLTEAEPIMCDLETRLLRPRGVEAGHGVAAGGFNIDDWAFDVVRFDEQSSGHCIALIFPCLLRYHDLCHNLCIDEDRLHIFLHEVERRYGCNPYHNRMHGCDVALNVHRFLTEFGFARSLSSLHMLAALFAALVHDFAHPGTSNAFEVKTFSQAALRYSDASVLEHHHLETVFSVLHTKGFNFLHALSREDYCEFRRTVVSMVLHTDLKGHFDFMARLKTLPAGALSTSTYSSAMGVVADSPTDSNALARPDDAFMLAVAIKSSDLGHAFKPWDQHKRWSQWVTEEFFLLGDREREMPDVKISPLCDRYKDTNLPKNQVGYFNFIILPFYSQVARVLPEAGLLLEESRRNFDRWEEQVPPSASPSPCTPASGGAYASTSGSFRRPNKSTDALSTGEGDGARREGEQASPMENGERGHFQKKEA